ncbi:MULTISPECIES: (2Fe-2S)-binding protein [Pseudonocardia]|nr:MULTISPECIES: 2Fe-2S iron-sulfur cluster-binding protein [Pseudonocardia]
MSRTTTVPLVVNGEQCEPEVDNRRTLLDLLRTSLGLTGTKKGCDHGQCGACTVLVDGERQLSCLRLAVTAAGSRITTIEGVADEVPGARRLQDEFVARDALQCGYCTPGQICSALGALTEADRGWPSHASANPATHPRDRGDLTRDELRERLSGNLCRCGAYPRIVDAVHAVAAGSPEAGNPQTGNPQTGNQDGAHR